MNARAVSCKWIMPEQSLLVKTLEEIGDKIDEAERTCGKLI